MLLDPLGVGFRACGLGWLSGWLLRRCRRARGGLVIVSSQAVPELIGDQPLYCKRITRLLCGALLLFLLGSGLCGRFGRDPCKPPNDYEAENDHNERDQDDLN